MGPHCPLCQHLAPLCQHRVALEHVNTLPSSNRELMNRLHQQQLTLPTFLLVDEQTAGYGRRAASWQSRADASLTCSLAHPIPPNPAITLAVGIALAQALRTLGVPAWLKWPNDIYCFNPEGQGKKLAGILVEGSPQGTQLWAVIGIGVNLGAQAHPNSASLDQYLSATALRQPLLLELLPRLLHALDNFASRGLDIDTWQALHGWQDQWVRVERNPEPALEGLAQGVDSQGRLLIKTREGCLETLTMARYDSLSARLTTPASTASG